MGAFIASLLSFWPSGHISDDGPHNYHQKQPMLYTTGRATQSHYVPRENISSHYYEVKIEYGEKWRKIGLRGFKGKQETVDKTSNEYERNGSIDLTKTINLFVDPCCCCIDRMSESLWMQFELRIRADAFVFENIFYWLIFCLLNFVLGKPYSLLTQRLSTRLLVKQNQQVL
ncbi:hypothetical protein OUZ56_022332 [Daphnia magna]|uniref:Uncharacterized protein n=1 Tax=Daphnia magna TaxID=35525 RepID=A0ABR0AW20_9CRUS|nr:hypothetical protein OUZ56_022332 [Daphnia magna]